MSNYIFFLKIYFFKVKTLLIIGESTIFDGCVFQNRSALRFKFGNSKLQNTET